MQHTRMLGISAALVAMMISCGGSSGGSDDVQTKIDAPAGSQHDAPQSTIDSPGSGSNEGSDALGTTCTPGSDAEAQGTCPTGFVCLSLQGATNPWCSKICTGPTDTSCATGYTGTGHPSCSFGVQEGSGSSAPVVDFCAVICEDKTGDNGICPAGSTCDGTCPGTLKCDATLSTSGGSAVGSACD